MVVGLREDMTASGVADEEGEEYEQDRIEIGGSDGSGGDAEENGDERLNSGGVLGRERLNNEKPD